MPGIVIVVSEQTMPAPPRDVRPEPGPEVLGWDECWSLLRSTSVGRLAFVMAGWPVVLPVNYAVDGQGILVRTGAGSKLNAARGQARVALEIDATDRLYRSGWSVLLFGTASEVTALDELERLAAVPLEPWARGERTSWIRIHPIQITGRRVPRSWRYPDPTT
jgi:nitroimidazol reductase NimA-like FMN-containing flavoprotein (pyridoxamine 5'-phosphate oxidase superfamily)